MSSFFSSTSAATRQDESAAHLTRAYGRVDLAGPLQLQQRTVGDDRFSITQLRTGNEVAGQVAPRSITVAYASRGFGWTTRDASGALHQRPALFGPHAPFTTHASAGAEVTTVSLAHDALAALARSLHGPGAHLQFDGAFPIDLRYAQRWRRLVDAVVDLPLVADAVRAHVHRALAFHVLQSFPLVGDPDARARAVALRSALYRGAVDFVEEHVGEGIGVPDVALAVGLTVGELRRVFVAYSPRGTTPEHHLRRARLASAHADLQRAGPSTSVGSIARRWGFARPGHFVSLFLQEYQRLPSDFLETDRGDR